MNGNCPAGFNHVLNWQKNKRKALLRRLRIDRSVSGPTASLLHRPKHTHTFYPCLSLSIPHVYHSDTCTLASEQVTEALIMVMATWKKGGNEGGGGRRGREKNGGDERAEQWGAGSHLWPQSGSCGSRLRGGIIVSSRV